MFPHTPSFRGFVFRVPPRQVPSDPTSPEWKKVAAVEEFFDIISAYHNTEDGFHLGIKKTLAKVYYNIHVYTLIEIIYAKREKGKKI